MLVNYNPNVNLALLRAQLGSRGRTEFSFDLEQPVLLRELMDSAGSSDVISLLWEEAVRTEKYRHTWTLPVDLRATEQFCHCLIA